jgi:hypothetical protein
MGPSSHSIVRRSRQPVLRYTQWDTTHLRADGHSLQHPTALPDRYSRPSVLKKMLFLKLDLQPLSPINGVRLSFQSDGAPPPHVPSTPAPSRWSPERARKSALGALLLLQGGSSISAKLLTPATPGMLHATGRRGRFSGGSASPLSQSSTIVQRSYQLLKK